MVRPGLDSPRRPLRRMAAPFAVVATIVALVASLSVAGPARAASPLVVVLPTTGTVDGTMASYLTGGIDQAANDGAAAVVIELNTPGGSLGDMQTIVSKLLDAQIPTIVWVGPSGAWAGSAGTFITLAGAVAIMAPGTNIGAASPVGSGGQDITGTEGSKVLSFTTSFIQAIAEARGRNVSWAVDAVQNARSSSASEAVSLHVVDGMAGSLTDAIAFANGRTVTVKGRQVTLDLAGATTDTRSMNVAQDFLHTLSDPNIAFILFVLGAFGLIAEVWHPNFVTGTIGAVSIVLAFIGFGSLPLNLAGLALVALGIFLLALEPSVPSHGLLAVTGMVTFVIGGSILYSSGSPGLPDAHVAFPITLLLAGLGLAFAAIAVRTVVRWRHVPALAIGPGGGLGRRVPAGLTGDVRRDLDPVGSVYVAGEEWSARASSGIRIARGSHVRVVGQDNLVLIVEPFGGDAPA